MTRRLSVSLTCPPHVHAHLVRSRCHDNLRRSIARRAHTGRHERGSQPLARLVDAVVLGDGSDLIFGHRQVESTPRTIRSTGRRAVVLVQGQSMPNVDNRARGPADSLEQAQRHNTSHHIAPYPGRLALPYLSTSISSSSSCTAALLFFGFATPAPPLSSSAACLGDAGTMADLDSPKSHSFTTPSLIRTLLDLRSRWRTPRDARNLQRVQVAPRITHSDYPVRAGRATHAFLPLPYLP